MGGIWEAGVKATKKHLKRILGNAHLTFEELYTVLAMQIEGILNSRPLSPISSDPNDFSALTPSHFLIGRPLTSLPDPDVLDIPINKLGRFQLMQQVQQHFWRRWTREFLSELQCRVKWKVNNAKVQVGTLVLLRDDKSPPLKWALGRIQKLHFGADGVPRVADVKTVNGVVRRSFAKLCRLPVDENQMTFGKTQSSQGRGHV